VDDIPEEFKPRKCQCGKQDLTAYVVRITIKGVEHNRIGCVKK
jgi:hypothetical protein